MVTVHVRRRRIADRVVVFSQALIELSVPNFAHVPHFECAFAGFDVDGLYTRIKLAQAKVERGED